MTGILGRGANTFTFKSHRGWNECQNCFVSPASAPEMAMWPWAMWIAKVSLFPQTKTKTQSSRKGSLISSIHIWNGNKYNLGPRNFRFGIGESTNLELSLTTCPDIELLYIHLTQRIPMMMVTCQKATTGRLWTLRVPGFVNLDSLIDPLAFPAFLKTSWYLKVKIDGTDAKR